MNPRRRSPGSARSAHAHAFTDGPDLRRRGLWLVLAFLGMATAVFGRLVQIQIIQGKALARAAASSHTTSISLHATRGVILDRNGHVLVSNVQVFDVFADPALVATADRPQVAGMLAPILQLSPAQILRALNQPNQFDYLAKTVSQDVDDKLQALGLSGIGMIPSEETVYEPSSVPGDSVAANLLGFVNADGVGQYGLEGYYNSILSGMNGHESTLTDVNGNAIVLGRQQMVPAQNGDNLELGLDPAVQFSAEVALANGVMSSRSTSGTLMIMDTHTGAIDAWAQYPSYNANTYASANIADFRDLAVTQPYEPGSIMKVITFAGGLNNNAFTPSTVIDEKQQRIDGFLIHDWDRRSHGNVSMQWVLDDSLNNGAIDAMKMEGQNAYYNNLLAFGIGAPTGVDLAGEVNDPLAPATSWSPLKYAEATFGQGLVTTPVEMLAAVNAVANGGVWVQPHAVNAIVNPNSGTTTPFVPMTRRVMSATAANTLAHMMVGVVNDPGAEGKRAKIPGWSMEIAGKTGTAQVALPNGGGYGPNVVASFVGFMPVTNPQFTMMVILNNPQVNAGNRFGSILAAPIWKQMAELMIDEWRIEP
ncbi:MAG: penicillin-binding protein 2 [Candidatus Dormiibacterota bacterium]